MGSATSAFGAPVTIHGGIFWIHCTHTLLCTWGKCPTLPRLDWSYLGGRAFHPASIPLPRLLIGPSLYLHVRVITLASLDASNPSLLHCPTCLPRVVSRQLFSDGINGLAFCSQARRQPDRSMDERLKVTLCPRVPNDTVTDNRIISRRPPKAPESSLQLNRAFQRYHRTLISQIDL